MKLAIRTSRSLLEHLETFAVDNATVADSLFDGGRLCYPGRKEIEFELGYSDPYTLKMEARLIEGLARPAAMAIRFLSSLATEAYRGTDPTLDLLWESHLQFSYSGPTVDPSLDRLVAALVAINGIMLGDIDSSAVGVDAGSMLVTELHSHGLPPTLIALEELWDGAPPACVGLGCVDL